MSISFESPYNLFHTVTEIVPIYQLEDAIVKCNLVGGTIIKADFNAEKKNYSLKKAMPITQLTCQEKEFPLVASMLKLDNFVIEEAIVSKTDEAFEKEEDTRIMHLKVKRTPYLEASTPPLERSRGRRSLGSLNINQIEGSFKKMAQEEADAKTQRKARPLKVRQIQNAFSKFMPQKWGSGG